LLDEAVAPFCAASGGEVNLSKSWGLTVGNHPPLVGMHPATGIPFVSSLESVKHLGLPLTTGSKEAAISELYQRKYGVVCARIKHWAKFEISALGRAHVAKQILASTLSYHATFLRPPAAQLTRISRAICGYVLAGSLLPEEEEAPLRGRPSRYVSSLPLTMGGIGLVDIEAQVSALQAKVAALLLHPQRASWKPLMAAAFDRAFPGLGVGVLLHQVPCRGRMSPLLLSTRHQHITQAFHLVGLHRSSEGHESMSKAQVGIEGLVGNHSVCGPTGEAFTAVTQLPIALRGVRLLRDVPLPLLHQLKLPASWDTTLRGPVNEGPWQATPDLSLARQRGLSGAEWEYFKVLPSARLCRLQQDPMPASPIWVPACVVSATQPSAHGVGRVSYLVGPWDSTQVDPSRWRLGTVPLLDFTVRQATSRIVQWQCHKAPGWVPGVGVRPKLWGQGEAGVQASAVSDMAGRQKRRFEEAMAAGARRRPANNRAWDPATLYYAAWFDPSPPRLHVRQRVHDRLARLTRQRAAQDAAANGIGEPIIDDSQDPVAGGEDATAPWVAVWRRAHHKRLSHVHRVFAWQLLHCALRCGGSMINLLGGVELASALCPHVACAAATPRPVATLQHVFLDCPAGRVALQWLCSLWGRLVPGNVPPFHPSVLLADSWEAWQPRGPGGMKGLWVVLRVAMLHSIYQAYRKACLGAGHLFTSDAIRASFVATVRGAVLREWVGVHGDVGALSGVCPSWLRGRASSMSEVDFVARWCAGGVLARVVPGVAGGPTRLRLCLNVHSV
jgi:hypothetical protein